MISRLLHTCGLYLGPESDMLPSSEDNPEGYWENSRFLEINERVLGALDGAWDVAPRFPNGWELIDGIRSAQQDAQALIGEFNAHEPWGWKDPRNSLTLPFWLSVLPDVRLVICVRHPVDVSASLAQRHLSSSRFGLSLWETYNARILSDLRTPAIVTRYESYFDDFDDELLRLVTFTGLTITDQIRLRARSSVGQHLRHHDAGRQPRDAGLSAPLIRLYEVLLESSESPILHPADARAAALEVALLDSTSGYTDRNSLRHLVSALETAHETLRTSTSEILERVQQTQTKLLEQLEENRRIDKDLVLQEAARTREELSLELRNTQARLSRLESHVAITRSETAGIARRLRILIAPLIFVRFVLGWLARCFDAVLRRTYRPRLVPRQEIRALQEGAWESTGEDPQFDLAGRLPWGWVRIHLRGSAEPAAIVRLYVDRGQGLDEANSHTLGVLRPRETELVSFINLGVARRIRLDPSTRAGRVAISSLEIKCVGKVGAAIHALRVSAARQDLRERSWLGVASRALALLRAGGVLGLMRTLRTQLGRVQQAGPEYEIWLDQNETAADERSVRQQIADLSYRPRISVLVPVYNPAAPTLERAVASVRNQIYEDWELCLADDASTDTHVRFLLERLAREDPRVRITFRERNGHISAASNSALQIATGEFVALLDQDDELSSDALARCALALNEHRNLDFIYSDEDKVTEDGVRFDPYFKPDWSPELLLSQMYTGHLSVYRAELVRAVGGFREGYEGSQDHDLALRVTERTAKIRHIPRVLYHWQAVPGSAATAVGAKPYASDAALRALEDAIARRLLDGSVEICSGHPDRYIVHLRCGLVPKVSIVIPTRDRADLLERCLGSVFDVTTHTNFEVVIVDNGSREVATSELFERWEKRAAGRLKVIRVDEEFNFPLLINRGVAASDGALIMMLNNDTEVLTPSWLDEMAGYSLQPEVGAVGCKLLYPDATIQHAGVVLMRGRVAGHGHLGYPGSAPGYFGRLLASSNYAAVTAACLMIRRAVFDEVGGMDECLKVAFNDVDFCLRVLATGRRNVCLGHVTLLHHESRSRGYEDTPPKQRRFREEVALMRERWERILDDDPYYSPNLCPDPPNFTPRI